MTLGQFLNFINENSVYAVGFFVVVPILAFVTNILAGQKAALSPWAYFYMFLIYVISIPATFLTVYTIYTIFIERSPLSQISLTSQVLPIFSLVGTVAIIKKKVALSYLPGFDRLSSFWLVMILVFGLMWFLQKLQFMVFSYLPIGRLLLSFLLLFGLLYWAWRRMFR
jgi:hypothetical protein